jgi:hypothetical protein
MARGKKKKADELTTDEALNRLFGKGAAKKLRSALQRYDDGKPRKKRRKTDDD